MRSPQVGRLDRSTGAVSLCVTFSRIAMTASLKSQLDQQQPLVALYDFHPPVEDFRAEVLRGLSLPQKQIAPQFLYDKQGSELFDAICEQPEYYVTRTEMAILQRYAHEMAHYLGDGALVEFGSGSSQKVRILLNAAPLLRTYVGLDISKQHLQDACTALVLDYPGLDAIAVCTDYTQPLPIDQISALQHQHTTGFFPGSSIGNLEPEAAISFLQNAAVLGDLIIGVDLKKSAAILEPAYDDAAGISAAFALNLLTRINRELGANFDLSQFTYRAHYNPEAGRIEMAIVSLADQVIRLDGMEIPFAAQETLITEYSYKYTADEFQMLAMTAGFQPIHIWLDPDQLFSIHYLKRL